MQSFLDNKKYRLKAKAYMSHFRILILSIYLCCFLDFKQLLVIIMFENLFYDLLKIFVVHTTFDVYKQLKGIKFFFNIPYYHFNF